MNLTERIRTELASLQHAEEIQAILEQLPEEEAYILSGDILSALTENNYFKNASASCIFIALDAKNKLFTNVFTNVCTNKLQAMMSLLAAYSDDPNGSDITETLGKAFNTAAKVLKNTSDHE